MSRLPTWVSEEINVHLKETELFYVIFVCLPRKPERWFINVPVR